MGEANSGAQVETTFSEGDEVRLGSTALLPAFLLSGDTAEVEDRRSSLDLNRRERRSGMMGEEGGGRGNQTDGSRWLEVQRAGHCSRWQFSGGEQTMIGKSEEKDKNQQQQEVMIARLTSGILDGKLRR